MEKITRQELIEIMEKDIASYEERKASFMEKINGTDMDITSVIGWELENLVISEHKASESQRLMKALINNPEKSHIKLLEVYVSELQYEIMDFKVWNTNNKNATKNLTEKFKAIAMTEHYAFYKTFLGEKNENN
jgi:hypothetical protein